MHVKNLLRMVFLGLFSGGLFETCNIIARINSPKNVLWLLAYTKMLSRESSKERFEEIYKKNLWFSDESVSGAGSTLEYTKNLRQQLPILLRKYNIERLLDVPCGDFNWMKEVVGRQKGLRYIGGDIVDGLIQSNNQRYASSNISFEIIDVTKDDLPSSDLIIVRDCLFHLSFADIYCFLDNLSRSNIKYLLISTHVFHSKFENKDIVSGGFRKIDIFSEPFGFPYPPLEFFDDFLGRWHPRQMCMFEVKKLFEHLREKQCCSDGVS